MSEGLRREVEDRLGIISIRDYGLTELGGPGVSIECPEKAGYHINEDYFYPEIIDPETGDSLPDGQNGELVLTTLQKEAVPILRYQTRDITHLIKEKCDCGRTLVRHGAIIGRTDDMLIIGGVNFYPSQLESVLLDIQNVTPHYLIRLTRTGRQDGASVKIETTNEFWNTTSQDSKTGFVTEVESKIKDLIGLKMDIKLVEPFSLPRSEGKAKRVVDERRE
jgi:phenylacetate-CoA ligase